MAKYGDAGINEVHGDQQSPDELVEVAESFNELLEAIPDETMNQIVL